MALGLEVALVLRAKGGANFLFHTQGISAKDINEATHEAMDILVRHMEGGDQADMDGSGDLPPGLLAGQLHVCRSRLRVVYRLVSAIWVMTVTPAQSNVLLCHQLIDATTRLLVAACKGVEVTPDKIARRYPEVYMAAGEVLGPGGLSLDAASLLAHAEAEVAGIAPETGAKPKSSSALKSRLGVGTRKAMHSSPSASSLGSVSAELSNSANRPLPQDGDYIGMTSFVLPLEAFTSAGIQEGPSGAAEAPNAPSQATKPLDDLISPAVPVPGAEVLAGTGLEILDAPTGNYRDVFGLQPPANTVSEDPWADFDFSLDNQSSRGVQTALDTSNAKQLTVPEPPSLPQPTPKQQKAIANGNSLQLLEVWRAMFIGSRLHMAGTFGEVLGTGAVPKCAANAAFRLAPPKESSKTVDAAAAATLGELGSRKADAEQNLLIAQFGEVQNLEAPFLKYQLPPTAVRPPVLLAVSVLEGRKPKRKLQPWQLSSETSLPCNGRTHYAAREPLPASDESQAGALKSVPEGKADTADERSTYLLAVTAAVSPEVLGRLRGVCIDLDVHPDFGSIIGAEGSCQWAQKERRARWCLYDLQPGSHTRLRIAFRPAAGIMPSRLQAACSQTMASMHAFGPPGHGLSGLALLSGAQSEDLRESRMAFHCEVFAKPELHEKRAQYSHKDMLVMAAQLLEAKILSGPHTEPLDSITSQL